MTFDQVMYQTFITLSVFALGSVTYNLMTLVLRRPKHWYGYFLAGVGSGLVFGILLAVVLPGHTVGPLTIQLGLYLLGLVSYSTGILIITHDLARRGADKAVEAIIEEHLDTGAKSGEE